MAEPKKKDQLAEMTIDNNAIQAQAATELTQQQMQVDALEVEKSQRCQYMVVAKELVSAKEMVDVGKLIEKFFKHHGVKQGVGNDQFELHTRKTQDGKKALVAKIPVKLLEKFKKFLKEHGIDIKKVTIAEAKEILGEIKRLLKEAKNEASADEEDSVKPKAQMNKN